MALGLQTPEGFGSVQSTGSMYAQPSASEPPMANMGPQASSAGSVNVGGVLTIQSAASVLDAEKRASDKLFEQQQAQPVITGLAGHITNFWTLARDAKLAVEQNLLRAVRARRGEYDPEKLDRVRQQGSSEIYMMLFSVKARQASSLVRDILMSSGTEKPWTIRPTPKPDLPPEQVNQIVQGITQEIMLAQQMGAMVTMDMVRERMRAARDQLDAQQYEEARVRAERMERLMEDQLAEGGFMEALDAFIDDLTTFKTAFIKGPVVRKRPKLTWGPNFEPVVEDSLVLEWERVDPFMIYPAPWSKSVHDGPLIERHRLSRQDLNALIGVEGYSEAAIRKVLDEYGIGGLRNWLTIDAQQAEAEGKDITQAASDNALIDAIQYWGSASGKMLREWGLDATQVPDEAKEYEIEAWMIGRHVIKAVLNADPLARRPYYADSYERVPGCFWGNSEYDLMSDCQDMCNAVARALVNNMGISSGPQVGINVDRLPGGEDITQMYPWKIWQFTNDPMGSTAKPLEFFQPTSNANELMGIFEKFSMLADEYTGIPRYMAGVEGASGAGRTASGMSMMIGNASKVIRQVIGSIDTYILEPLLDRLYYHNMVHSDDPELKGDLRIQARGAMSLTAKEAAQVRRNEFLATTANPFDMQIVGLEGRAAILREAAKALDMDPDKVVAPLPVLRQRMLQQQIMMAQQAQQQAAAGGPSESGQELENGAPTSDHFGPVRS